MALEEGEFGDKARGALGGIKRIGREFIKGFMGNMPEDNPFSKGAYRAFGSTLVPSIDGLFEELIERLQELENHDEGKQLKAARFRPDGTELPDQPMSIKEFSEFLLEDVLPMWLQMTAIYRGSAADLKTQQDNIKGSEPGEADPEDETIAEAIRRGVREELQRRATS